jgi:hypothetical protein
MCCKKLLTGLDFNPHDGKYNHQSRPFDFNRIPIKYQRGCSVHTDVTTIIANIVESYKYFGVLNTLYNYLHSKYTVPYVVAGMINDFIGESEYPTCLGCLSYVSFVSLDRRCIIVDLNEKLPLLGEDYQYQTSSSYDYYHSIRIYQTCRYTTDKEEFYLRQIPTSRLQIGQKIICNFDKRFRPSFESDGVQYRMLADILLPFVPINVKASKLLESNTSCKAVDETKQIIGQFNLQVINYTGPKVKSQKWKVKKNKKTTCHKNKKDRKKQIKDKMKNLYELTMDENENIDIYRYYGELDEESLQRERDRHYQREHQKKSDEYYWNFSLY